MATKAKQPEPEVTPDVEPPTIEEQLGDADPYEYVRAKAAEGWEYTTTRVAALSAGSTVLDHKPARDEFGTLIPTKTVLDLSAEAPPTDAEGTQPEADTKEN